jgi:hypothetical protein
LVETAAKCRGTAASPSRPASQARTRRAFASVSCVVKVFEHARRVERRREVGELGAVDVRHEMGAQQSRVVGCERGRRHGRAEVAAADADADDVGEARAARAGQPALVHRAHERRALRTHGHHFAMLARERGGRAAGRDAQQRVQRCAALAGVHRRPRKQRFDAGAEALRLRQRRERVQRRRIQALPAEVEQQARGLAREAAEAVRIGSEQLAYGDAGEAVSVSRERVSQGS